MWRFLTLAAVMWINSMGPEWKLQSGDGSGEILIVATLAGAILFVTLVPAYLLTRKVTKEVHDRESFGVSDGGLPRGSCSCGRLKSMKSLASSSVSADNFRRIAWLDEVWGAVRDKSKTMAHQLPSDTQVVAETAPTASSSVEVQHKIVAL